MAAMPSFQEVIGVMEEKRYAVFGSRTYDLNLVGVRTLALGEDKFNDWGYCFHYDQVWSGIMSPITTDPGTYYRNNPLVAAGTALMIPGQYRGAYRLGKHQGKYLALVQAKPIRFWRVQPGQWANIKPADMGAGWTDLPVENQVIGANHHRALDNIRIGTVGKFSAACQVWPEINLYYCLIGLAQAAAASVGESFSYTLLTEGDFHRAGS